MWILFKLVNVVSRVSQGSVLGPLLFLLYSSELLSILENKLIGYVMIPLWWLLCLPQSLYKVTVAESLIRDLDRVREWCDLWSMKLNASKTKTVIVSRSRTMQSPTLTIGGTVLKKSNDLDMFWVRFDSLRHLRKI